MYINKNDLVVKNCVINIGPITDKTDFHNKKKSTYKNVESSHINCKH